MINDSPAAPPGVLLAVTRPQWLATDLRRRLLGGEWPRGSRIPSETELANTYKVSRVTVRTAIRRLESQGLVDIRHGSGTFVADFGVTMRAGLQELGSITETIRETGHEPGMEWRSRQERPATAVEAERLDLPEGAPVLALERAILSDGEVVAYSYDVMRLDILPREAAEEIGKGSVFNVLNRFGLRPRRAFATLHVVKDNSVGWGSRRPADGLYLLLNQVHFSPASERLMYSRTYFVEGRFEFVILRTA